MIGTSEKITQCGDDERAQGGPEGLHSQTGQVGNFPTWIRRSRSQWRSPSQACQPSRIRRIALAVHLAVAVACDSVPSPARRHGGMPDTTAFCRVFRIEQFGTNPRANTGACTVT